MGRRKQEPRADGVLHRPRYEAHITFAAKDKGLAQRLANESKWSFSQITDDDVLGPGQWCYLTLSGPDAAELMGLLYHMRDSRCSGMWVRCKIEQIMYDQRKE